MVIKKLFHTFTKNTHVFAKDCIDASIPFIRLSDTVGYAIDLMQEYKTDLLAVIEHEKLLGTLSEKQLLEIDDLQNIGKLQTFFLPYKTNENTHIFDVLKSSVEFNTFYIPVVYENDFYIGITTPQKLLQQFVQSSSVATNGGIIILELETKDYSLTEISKIVESNDAVILHSMIAVSTENAGKIYVSLKINKIDLQAILLTFERYQYQVIAVLHESEYELQLKERYDSLMRYLEV